MMHGMFHFKGEIQKATMKDQKGQEVEWSKAQKIAVSVDLIPAAKQLLQFLAAIDRNTHLYQGPTLDRAIHRYQNGRMKHVYILKFVFPSFF